MPQLYPTQYPNTYPYVNGISVLTPGSSGTIIWGELAVDWGDETATWQELQPE
jgi:hypothetical protein